MDAGERWEERHGDGIRADCTLNSYFIVPGYSIFFAFQTPVRVIEPNPNWSTLGLRDCINDCS